MKKYAVQTENAPAAIGPYAQAWVAGDLLFTSGQLGLDPETGLLAETVEEQTEQSLKNIRAIAEAAGFRMNDIVRTTVFLRDMADFAAVNAVYEGFFGTHRPARSCVAVAGLPKGGRVEIEVTAVRGEDDAG